MDWSITGVRNNCHGEEEAVRDGTISMGNGANRTSGQIPQARADDRSTTETNSQPTLNQFRFMEQQGDGNGDAARY